MSDIEQRIADIIRQIPHLTAHRFLDTDGEWSVKMHSADEIAEMIAPVLVAELGLRAEISSFEARPSWGGPRCRYVTDWEPTQ